MDLSPFEPQRIRLMGQSLDLVTCDDVLRYLGRKASARRKVIIANHNAHSLYLVDRHREMRAFYDRVDLIEIDSTPLILWGKLMGEPVSRGHRATYLSWREQFWALANQNQWRVFYLGGEPGVAERAAQKWRGEAPGASIATQDGYFDVSPGSKDNADIVARINAFDPHVLFVGMGMPRQEIWVERNYDALVNCVVLTVGAAFDYDAGVQHAAPRWTGRLGIEWLYRFFTNPRRLFSRYFLEPWSLIPKAAQDAAGRFRPVSKPRPALHGSGPRQAI